MPGRKIPLVTNQIYHVLNRSILSQPIFIKKKDYQREIEAAFYYRNKNPLLSYSHFLNLSLKKRKEFLKNMMREKNFLVEVIAYCLMSNHFHFLLKQLQDNGISIFMGNLTNSYARYFNTLNKRAGPLFEGRFKAIRIETDEQLIHISRYIHLNPYSSGIIKTIKELGNYPYSSFREYLNLQEVSFCNKEIVLNHFGDPTVYQKFVYDQADYQKYLQALKQLALEDI